MASRWSTPPCGTWARSANRTAQGAPRDKTRTQRAKVATLTRKQARKLKYA